MRFMTMILLCLLPAMPAAATDNLSGVLKTLGGAAPAPAQPADPGKPDAPAPAPVPVPKANFDELQPDLSAIRIQKVIDPLTLLSDKGTIYKLSGIDIPDDSDIAVQAMKELATLTEGQDVKIYLTRDEKTGRSNRLGQTLAQIERKKDTLWIEGQLLGDGLARVRTTGANPEMARQMLALEQAARDAKRGIWANGAYKILTPDEAADKKNSFQIVEGTVFSVSQRNNETFLNFSADWKKDFTISISPELRRDLSRRNINFLGLEHKKVRVRGWIEDRNGPMITLDHGQQLELLESGLPSLQEPIKPSARSFKSIEEPVAPTVETPEIEKPVVKKPEIKTNE